jgi:hypothetical protein
MAVSLCRMSLPLGPKFRKLRFQMIAGIILQAARA